MLVPQVSIPFPLRWGFTTRGEDPPHSKLRELHQVHGTEVHRMPGPARNGDGLWTTQADLPIGVHTADCAPVLLAGLADGGPWIAALHAGWRGAVGGRGTGRSPGILRVAISIFVKKGGRPEDLVWAFGPCIQRCHFEVGEEVIAAARMDPAWRDDLVEPGPRGRPHLDLHGLLRAQAYHMGLDPAREGSIPRCTVCEPESFFSYRLGDTKSRQWGWIEIEP